ncbi:SE1561 family protein [Halobacillus salinus]|uniref:SE1561 family protein n=1 Tax=Halobacillus salinus TaxID=192814 RepID=UPI0014565F6E|nr:SE1561 family protein [Halobacillus salinus]
MAQQEQIQDLKVRLSQFVDRIEALDPEETSVEDIDRLISMLEELENKMKE